MPILPFLRSLPVAVSLAIFACTSGSGGGLNSTIIIYDDDTVTTSDNDIVARGAPDGTSRGAPDEATTDVSVEDASVAGKGPPPGSVGAACFNNEACNGGTCLGYDPGYCTQACAASSDCGAGKCLYDGLQDAKVCFRPCVDVNDCQQGNLCLTSVGVCRPPCTPDSCVAGKKCNPASGVCEGSSTQCDSPVPEVCGDLDDNDCNGLVDEGCPPAPALASWTNVIDLGMVNIGPFGNSKDLAFKILPGVTSFEIIALSEGKAMMGLLELKDPKGVVLNNGAPFQGTIRYAPAAGVMSVLVPNTTTYDVVAGTYAFALFRMDASQGLNTSPKAAPGWVRVVIVAKFGDLSKKSGTLDLAFHFVKNCGLTAAKAQKGLFPKVVNQLKTIYSQAGVTIGSIEYDDLDGPGAEKYTYIDSTIGTDSEVAELMKLGKSGDGTERLHVYFVKHINGESGFGYVELGQAGGLPGPAFLDGTVGSGVVMGMDTFAEIGWSLDEYTGIVLTATTLAHEIGHFLGLFHVVEQTWDYDPIPDTPECPKQNGLPDESKCKGKSGTDNLMFWSNSGGALLTPDQGTVIRHFPEVGP